MYKNSIVLIFGILAIAATVFAQPVLPVEGSTVVLVDSSTHWRLISVYRSDQIFVFYEPQTDNLLASYYFLGTSADEPNRRQIGAAVSTDGGANWNVYKEINAGVGDGMNGYYPTSYGNPTTPILVYYNRANPDENISSQPILATDLLGWGGGLWDNVAIDAIGTVDTVLDFRYNTMAIAPDNPDLWLVGGIFYEPAPGLYPGLYRSTDGGGTWSRPIRVLTSHPDDTLKSNYVFDYSGSRPPLAISAGAGNKVYGVVQVEMESGDPIERVVYVTSDDGGLTWTDPVFIPGTESLWFSTDDTYRNFATLIDAAGNWHVFGVGVDTTEMVAGEKWPYRIWDFRFDGESWNINKFGFPQLLNQGIVEPPLSGGGSDEEDVMNSPALGPDGTLYYAYTDVYDTTDAGGDPENYKYRIYVMISQDNGSTWQGPAGVFEDPGWQSDYPCDIARTASDKLHFVYRVGGRNNDEYKELNYLGVPTQGIKDLILSLPDDHTSANIPKSHKLYQNYPNPFNPNTTIRFDLKENTHVKITVFNLLGQHVATLIDKDMTAGLKAVVLNAAHLSSGKYFYRLETDTFTDVKEMILIK